MLGKLVYPIIIAMVCLFLNGCQESMSSEQIRQARLVGNENLVLKKQMQEKEAEIAKKNTLISDKNKEIADLKQQLEQARQDATKATERLSTIEKSFSDASAGYQKQIEEYQAALDAKPVPYPELEEKYNAMYADLLKKLTECEAKLEKYESAAAEQTGSNASQTKK